MIRRAGYDLLRVGLRIAVQLWPLWLFWFAWSLSSNMWLGYLQTFPNRSAAGYALAYRAWPSIALLGPILLMLAAILAYRMQLATRVMPIAGIGGVLVATALTGWPEYQRLASYVGRASPIDILGALDLGILQAVAVGIAAAIFGWAFTIQRTLGTGPRLIRGRSDNYRPCRLALHPRGAPPLPRSGRNLWRDRRRRSLPRRPGPGRPPRLRSRPTRPPGVRAAPRRCWSIPAAPGPPTPWSSADPAASRPPPSAFPPC